jgi:hypothetical protein
MAKSLFFGKHCEHLVFAELLKRGFDTYLPIVDDKGVDCIIRNNNGTHVDIQIKGRQPRWIFNFGQVKTRPNYFFILYPPDKNFYIVPSSEISKWLNGRKKLAINNELKERLEKDFKNNFNLLSY